MTPKNNKARHFRRLFFAALSEIIDPASGEAGKLRSE